MINLFNEIVPTTDGKFMCLSKDILLTTDNLLHNHIKKCLMEGMRRSELVNLKGLRNGGTTFTLIEFAKENNLFVIVPDRDMVSLREKYDYKGIYSIGTLVLARGRKTTNVAIDVGVYSKENIEKIKDMGFNIVTGYVQDLELENKTCEKNKNFDEEVIENLKREIVLLGKSMRNERSRGNFSNYKHLINSYKEIMGLIQDLSKENNADKGTIRIKANEDSNIVIDKDGIREGGLNIGESLKNISKTPEKEKFYMEFYYREGKEPASIGIFNKDKLWIITNVYNVDEIIKFIENDTSCEKDNSIFYVDINGFGIDIYNILKHNGYNVCELECKILNN